MVSMEARRAALQSAIGRYLSDGYRVVSQTDTTAQLVKPKKFSLFMCLIMFGIFYIPYYMAKKDKQVYLQVDEAGVLHETQQ